MPVVQTEIFADVDDPIAGLVRLTPCVALRDRFRAVPTSSLLARGELEHELVGELIDERLPVALLPCLVEQCYRTVEVNLQL
ncbi:MAG TPA: hypothetical protein VFH76_24760 [Kribbella sp.]|nr:hypothetical protein [Kribbella sp.]